MVAVCRKNLEHWHWNDDDDDKTRKEEWKKHVEAMISRFHHSNVNVSFM